MPTDLCLLVNVKRLRRNARAGSIPTDHELLDLVADWAITLDGVTDTDLDAAALRWLRGDSPFMPTAGQILAFTPQGEAIATIGSPGDADRAFADFSARMTFLAGRGGPDREDTDRHLDPDDPYRNDAMFLALAAIGGPGRWYGSLVGDRGIAFAWREGYRLARIPHARQPQAIALTVAAHAQIAVTSRRQLEHA